MSGTPRARQALYTFRASVHEVLWGKLENTHLLPQVVAALPQHMAVSLWLTAPFQKNSGGSASARGIASGEKKSPGRKAGGFPLCAAA